MVPRMRVLVEGIGGVIAARLSRAGHSPSLVTGNPAIATAINEHGLRVKIPECPFTRRAPA